VGKTSTFLQKTLLPISFPPYRPALATFGCESWTVRKNKGLDAFEMKGLRDSAGFVDSKENK